MLKTKSKTKQQLLLETQEVRTRLYDLAHLLLEKKVVQGEERRGMLSKYKPGIAASLPEPPS